MSDLLAARAQMAISLAFHIVFAVAGIGMPLMMVIAEGAYRRSGVSEYRDLAIRWSKGTAILFAVGAVSGTVLSFELGLLWPAFMRWAGPIIGMPFSQVARNQPVKLAAMEGQFGTETGAPLRLGGIPNTHERQTHHAIEIPYGLSLLAFHDPQAVVKGLNDFPPEDWPPVAVVHLAFQVMVGPASP
jgi:cytochrome bd-type quinol oxidase subunit 1